MEDAIEAEIRCVEAGLAAAEAVSAQLATPEISLQPITRAGAQRLAAAVDVLAKNDTVASASLANVAVVVRAAKVAQDVIRTILGQ